MKPAASDAPPASAADAGLLQAMASVAEATCGAVAVTDADDRIAWVNAGFTRITGWTLEEARGRQLAALVQRTADEGTGPWPLPRPIGEDAPAPQTPPVRLRRRCGAGYWATVDLRRLPAACAPLAHLHLHSDVSESVIAGQRTHEFERWLQLAGSVYGIGLWQIGVRDGVLVWDANLKHMFGLAPEAATPDLREIVDRYVYEEDRALLARALREAPPVGAHAELEFRIRRLDGQLRTIVSRHAAIEGEHSRRPERVLGAVVDVSALRRAERERDRLGERIQLVAEAVGLGIWEYEPAARRSTWNDRMYALFGQTRDSFRDRLWLEVVHADDLECARQAFERTVATGAPFDVEFRVLHPDGQARWIAARGRGERDADGAIARVLGVNWDLSERRAAEAALRAQEAAERASAAKSEFLSRMSHELRTPLNAILGFAQLLEIDARQPLAPAQRERVGHISQAGWHLLDLINEVLDLARIEAGAARLELGAVALEPLLRECLALVEAEAQRRGLEVALQLAPGLAPLVRADRARLKQIVLNLLSNAVKYNRDHGRIDIVARSSADGTTIAVRDSGRGMSAGQLSELFQPFNRLGLESAPVEGTGIGLTIALKLAEQMGGRLEAASEAGVGSEFRLTLPSAADADAGSVPASLPARTDLAGCVLCVEDNADNAELVMQWLKLRPNLTVFHARDGAAAQVMAEVCQPDLILLDMRLPDTTGAQLAQRLRALPGLAGVPCVAVSANTLAADLAAARAAGIGEYLTKPLDGAALLGCIDRLLADPAHRR